MQCMQLVRSCICGRVERGNGGSHVWTKSVLHHEMTLRDGDEWSIEGRIGSRILALLWLELSGDADEQEGRRKREHVDMGEILSRKKKDQTNMRTLERCGCLWWLAAELLTCRRKGSGETSIQQLQNKRQRYNRQGQCKQKNNSIIRMSSLCLYHCITCRLESSSHHYSHQMSLLPCWCSVTLAISHT